MRLLAAAAARRRLRARALDHRPRPAERRADQHQAAFHWLFQVEDPDELDRVWPQLLVKSFATMLPGTQVPLGFLRPKHARDGSGAWSRTSLGRSTTLTPARPSASSTTASREVIGDGLTVDPPDVRLIEGGRVDLAGVPGRHARGGARRRAQQHPDRAAQGEARRPASRPGEDRSTVSATLRLDLELDTEDGWKTIAELWIAGAGHTGASRPFRESDSLAAYFSVHKDGIPFLFDSGGAIKYTLHPDDRAGPPVQAFVDELLWLGGDRGNDARRRRVRPDQADRRRLRPPRLGRTPRSTTSPPSWPKGRARLHPEGRQAARRPGQDCCARRRRSRRPPRVGGWPDARGSGEYNENYGAALFGSKFAIVRERMSELGWEPEFLGARDCEPLPRQRRRPSDAAGLRGLDEVGGPQHLRGRGPGAVAHLPRRRPADPARGHLQRLAGLRLPPGAGDCQPLLDHVRDVWCAGRDDAYDAIMNHMAAMVQHPELTGLPIVALVGEKEGAGKNIIIENIFLPLYGTHGIILDRPDALTGRFNSHLGWCVFLCANEAIWGGDKQREGAYKTVFTDTWRPLEKKFRDIVMVRNYTKAFALSNNEWFAPISVRDRRHLVLDVAEHRVGDTAYFKRLHKHIVEDGGREAFLAKLLARKVDFDLLRRPPDLRSPAKTAAILRSRRHPSTAS